jgi:hypothetical protein
LVGPEAGNDAGKALEILDTARLDMLGCAPIAPGSWDRDPDGERNAPQPPRITPMKKLLAAVVAFAFVSPVFAEEKKVEEKKVEKKAEEKKVEKKADEKKDEKKHEKK